MKKAALCLILFLGMPLFLAGAAEFRSPTWDIPYYRILFPLSVDRDGWTVQELRINGRKWDTFFVLREGRHIDLSKPLAKGDYSVEADYAWRSGTDYTLVLLYQEPDSQEVKKFSVQLQSPSKGGIPFEAEGFYRVFRAEELIGLERKGEICSLTLTAAKENIQPQGFILAEGPRPVPYQVLGIQESTPPAKTAGTHPVTLTCKIAFPLDMSPYQKKMLLLLQSARLKAKKTGFTITGEGVGKTVKNEILSLEFHPQSGQINTIENREHGIKIFNEAGVIHWNPGVHIPGRAWDHSFNWNPPPDFAETAGEYLYVNTRRGPLQRIKEVHLEVRYTLEASSPYFVSETLLRVDQDLGVSAIRNDEMVLYKELFDSLLYKDKKGQTVRMPLQEDPSFPDGLVHVAPDDVEWAGLVNSDKKFGFFGLRLEYSNPALIVSGNWLNKPGTYFYAAPDGKYVYWVRPLLYTWSEYPTRNLLTHVPAGSLFYEKNAYIILPLDEDLEENLDLLLRELKNPVRIH